jgi:hypothetical protein
MSAQPEMVRLVPPPPLEVSSCLTRRETAGWESARRRGWLCDGCRRTADGLYDAGEHSGEGVEVVLW